MSCILLLMQFKHNIVCIIHVQREEDFVERRVSLSIKELMPPDDDNEYEDLTPVDTVTMERLMIKKQAKTRQMAARERYCFIIGLH